MSIQEIVDAEYGIFDWENPNSPVEDVEDAGYLLESLREQSAEMSVAKNTLITHFVKH